MGKSKGRMAAARGGGGGAIGRGLAAPEAVLGGDALRAGNTARQLPSTGPLSALSQAGAEASWE